jgi:hypothetical protein
MTASRQNRLAAFLRRNGVALLLSAGLFALVYTLVFRFRTGDSDYIDHMLWAIAMSPKSMLASLYNGTERLWHIGVKLLILAGVSNTWKAAALITAAADTAAYFLIYKAWEAVLPEKCPRWLAAGLLLCVFLVNALTLPGGSIYSGRGAVNTWHNPTNIMVRPFAAAVFYMTVRIYNRRCYGCPSLLEGGAEPFSFSGGFWAQFRQPVYTRWELVCYPLCLLLSTYAKPSFLQFFAPAIFLLLVYDLVRTRGMLFPFCVKLALAYLPAGLILLSQFSNFFGVSLTTTAAAAVSTTSETAASTASSAGVALYFVQKSFGSVGEFFLVLIKQLWLFVCLSAFPLFVLCLKKKNGPGTTLCRLSGLGVLMAWLESALLHETGSRATHGNFVWGYFLSLWLFWSAAMGLYIPMLSKNEPRHTLARWVGLPLLACHLAAGIVYLVHIYETGLYVF